MISVAAVALVVVIVAQCSPASRSSAAAGDSTSIRDGVFVRSEVFPDPGEAVRRVAASS